MTEQFNRDLESMLSAVMLLDIPVRTQIHPDLPYHQSNPQWLQNPLVASFIDGLRSVAENQKFDDKLQFLGSTGFRVTMENLASWIRERADLVGVAQALRDVDSYNLSESIAAFKLYLLLSIHSDQPYTFSNGVQLTQAQRVPNKHISRMLFEGWTSTLPIPKIHSVLIEPIKLPVFHGDDNDNESRKKQRFNIPTSDSFELVRLSLALARPDGFRGVQGMAYTVFCEDSLPIMQSVSGWHLISHRSPDLPSPQLIEIECQKADEILIKLEALTPGQKNKILIPIRALCNYYAEHSLVARAIDLRTCLESLFLDDGNKDELRFRLALRAAKLLGDSTLQRKTIKKQFISAYDAASGAVHNGKLPKKGTENIPVVANLAHKAILKMLNDGFPNWETLELGP